MGNLQEHNSQMTYARGIAGKQFTKFGFNDLHTCLAEVKEVLQSLNSSTEHGFLSVGKELQSVYLQASTIADMLSGFIQQLSQSENDATIAQLHNLADHFADCLDRLNTLAISAHGHIQTIEDILEALPEIFKEFARVVKQLQMMGIATRIENARFGVSELGFEHLAESVYALSEEIQHKTKEVIGNLSSIEEVVRHNSEALTSLQTDNRLLRMNVVQQLKSNFQLLQEKHDAHTTAVQSIVLKSTAIVKSINTVVEAVQFHDITRQQIEHVIEALDELVQKQPSRSELFALCQLQTVQLTDVADEFDRAINRIVDSLKDLSTTVQTMNNESGLTAGLAQGSHATFLTIVEERFGSIITALSHGSGTISAISKDIGTIETVINRMQQYMDELSDVGAEIELLSFNSRIKSAKAGPEGAGLGVIAESIQRISFIAHQHITAVVEQIDRLIKVSHETTQEIQSSICSYGESELSKLTVESNTLVSFFHNVNAVASDTFCKTEETCTVLTQKLRTMADTMNDYHSTTMTLRSLCETMHETVERNKAVISEDEQILLQQKLESLKQRYTMEKERQLHDAAFHHASADAPDVNACSNTTEFGTNVELF